jgi:hypothetical protein
MPRRMPRFDLTLARVAQSAIEIVQAGEITHASSAGIIRKQWTAARVEALYELAYLRVFAAWEVCLEAIFYRSLCGYASAAGQETLKSGGYFPNIAAAEAAVLRKGTYTLWHSPHRVITRCQTFIVSGRPGCPAVQETVVSSHLTRLAHFAATRHRIVHDQSDAKNKFDTATLQIVGRTYAAARPGRFLRDWDASSSPPQRWLEVMTGELTGLAAQMV